MKVSNGLEFPVVALPGVGHMPAKGENEQETVRVFYVAATRTKPRLVMGVIGDGLYGPILQSGDVNRAAVFRFSNAILTPGAAWRNCHLTLKRLACFHDYPE
jgi:superfamily I DNA/RNA helicase